jgi:hypothetical protein
VENVVVGFHSTTIPRATDLSIKMASKKRFFVHANNASSTLQEGDKVSFEVEEGPKGLVAVKVNVLR